MMETDETIGSLIAECRELTQQIDSEKDRLERFMLETGGASDASDHIQENIDSLKEMLAGAEGRLQALYDRQEAEASAPARKATDGPGNMDGRASVKKRLAEKKAEASAKDKECRQAKNKGKWR